MKKESSSFDQTLEEVQRDEDLRMKPRKINAKSRGVQTEDPGYDCSHMSTWRWMANNTIYIPGMGKLATTNYAEKAAANKLGFKSDVFLAPIRHDPELVQQALQPSVNARREDKDLMVKVVARRFPVGEEPTGVAGILRGVVSPTYGEVSDAQLLHNLDKIAGTELRDMDVTARRTDAASYFTFAYQDQKTLKALSEIGDNVSIGLKGWNSEVGHHKVQFDTFLERLICTNGMVVRLGGESLFSRRHTGIINDELKKMLEDMWKRVPDLHERVLAGTEFLHSIKVEDPDEELETFLARKGQPQYIRDAAKKAFLEEPISTAYGVLQAITRLSVTARKDPDRQLRLEQIGGEYMVHKTARSA